MSDAPRDAVPADLPGYLELLRQLTAESPPPPPEAAAPIWARLLATPGTGVIVLGPEGTPLACCTLHILDNLTRAGRPYALIENVVAHAARRGQGLGRAVVEDALRRARDAGCYKASLSTRNAREVTGFYAALGFRSGHKTLFEHRF